MANNYRVVLARPGALRLLSTALVGRLPQGMSSLSVLLLVRASTHSYAAPAPPSAPARWPVPCAARCSDA